MTKKGYTYIAFLIAPLASPLGYLLSMSWILLFDTSARDFFSWGLVVIAYMLPIAYVAIFLLWYPTYLALKHYKVLRMWSCLISGLIIGLLVTSFFYYTHNPTILHLGTGAASGLSSALVFWLLIRMAPNQSFKPTRPHGGRAA
jgi:hypothetical protein